MPMIEVEGLRIAYERAGDGPPLLLLLHGYVGDGWTTWRRQIEWLSDDFTVVAWDAPGAGRSSDPPESFGIAGWAGSLPADIAEQRLQQALVLANLSPDEFVGALLPTMFSEGTPPESVDDFGATMLAFHPAGFRAMARASAEDLREVLPHIRVPTLLVYGDQDVRAPMAVAENLHAPVSGSKLVLLPDTGHLCNIEAPEEFNRTVRNFLRDIRS
jgi:pimeloyl-ACP methyl ester carboxylesterase